MPRKRIRSFPDIYYTNDPLDNPTTKVSDEEKKREADWIKEMLRKIESGEIKRGG